MIIFLNGSTNAGKTTVARILHKKIPQSSIVEIDALIEKYNHLSSRSRLDNGIEEGLRLIEKLRKKGFHAIVPFPLSQEHYNHFSARLQTIDQLFFFTLDPSLNIAISNRGKREITRTEQERILQFYNLSFHRPDFGICIDTSHQKSDGTATVILRYLKDVLE